MDAQKSDVPKFLVEVIPVPACMSCRQAREFALRILNAAALAERCGDTAKVSFIDPRHPTGNMRKGDASEYYQMEISP